MKEKVIITFIATVAGLLLTTLVFYFYQTPKPQQPLPEKKGGAETSKKVQSKPTQKPSSKLFLEIEDPKDELLQESRTIKVSGKTNSNNIVIISSSLEDITVAPSENETFSTSITIETGTSILTILSISPEGEVVRDQRVVTYTTEEF